MHQIYNSVFSHKLGIGLMFWLDKTILTDLSDLSKKSETNSANITHAAFNFCIIFGKK